LALKRGVKSGFLLQPKGTGASGSFKLAKKVAVPAKKKAPAKKPAKKSVATTKKTTPKKKKNEKQRQCKENQETRRQETHCQETRRQESNNTSKEKDSWGQENQKQEEVNVYLVVLKSKTAIFIATNLLKNKRISLMSSYVSLEMFLCILLDGRVLIPLTYNIPSPPPNSELNS